LDFNKSILQDIRVAVGLDANTSDFDTELLMHINSAIGSLNQNGIGNFLVVDNETQAWRELKNPEQTAGNQFFKMIPLFITISTKLLFDPPPPSSVQYHSDNANQILWRLKIAYEESYVPPTTEGSEY
jgi:hypothetical protein